MTRLLVGPLLRHVGETDATVWVETDGPCEVSVRAGGVTARERTWTMSGHHYALVEISGLPAASTLPYQVDLDDDAAWPPLVSDRPPSVIRTRGGDAPVRIVFGSCRYGRAAATLEDQHFDRDSLAAYAHELAYGEDRSWPDALLHLGDQVYADETSTATQRRIRAKREITDDGPGLEVADFEEYTWLYLESWTDPDVRWLLSTVPSYMIFDDHDVRDDWNTSHAWRLDLQRTSWWEERIVGGLSSYWIYQHLGNLSPAELRDEPLYQQVRTHGADVAPLLRSFAAAADREADGGKGARWSYRRDFGRVRLVMVDSRCGRILAEGQRSMLSEAEFRWLEQQVDGDYDHLLIGTSLPWLLPRALHDIESWDERLSSGVRGRRVARFAEWLRRAADLEHWASFRKSFDRLAALIQNVGSRPDAPATISVLSGDVHHAYVAEAHFDPPVSSRVYQLTCSPLHNYVPWFMKITFRLAWSGGTERIMRLLLGMLSRIAAMPVSWSRLSGPYFGNELAELVFTGRRADTCLRRSSSTDEPSALREVDGRTLAG